MSPVTKKYCFRNKQWWRCQPSTAQVLKPAWHLHQVKRDSKLRQLFSMKKVCGQILPFCLQSQRGPSVLWQTFSALRWGNVPTFCPNNGNHFVYCHEAVQMRWTKDKVTSHHMLQQLSLRAGPSYSQRSARKMGNQDLGRDEWFLLCMLWEGMHSYSIAHSPTVNTSNQGTSTTHLDLRLVV